MGKTFVAPAHQEKSSPSTGVQEQGATSEIRRAQDIKKSIVPILISKLAEQNKTVHDTSAELKQLQIPAEPNESARIQQMRMELIEKNSRATELIKAISRALHRIDMNQYGICHACGDEIAIKRLKASPTTTLCVDCQSLAERNQ